MGSQTIVAKHKRAGADFLLKAACVLAVVGGTMWALLPSHRVATGIRAVAARDKKMPDFSLPSLDGGVWKLSDHRGQVILVNFWATWCPPCREETPGLIRVSRELAGQPFQIAGIAMDDDGAKAAGPFVKRYGIPYPILLPNAQFALSDAIESLPSSFLLDRQGRIAKVYVGEADEAVVLRDARILLAESPQSK